MRRTATIIIVLLFPSFSAVAIPSATAGVIYGQAVTQYATAVQPQELAFDPDGNLFAGQNSPTNGDARIWKVLPGGGSASPWGDLVNDPDSVTVYGDNVYTGGNPVVSRINRFTGVTTALGSLPSARNIATIVAIQGGNSYGSAGDIMIGDATGRISLMDGVTGGVNVLVDTNPSLKITRGLLFAQDQLYCVETSAALGVWHIAADGTLTPVDDQGFNWAFPRAMAYLPDNDSFYVGDSALGEILRLPRLGGPAEVVGTGFDNIEGLQFDAENRLYISDAVNGVIWRSAPVPEPSTIILSLLACMTGLYIVWRQRKHTTMV